MINNSRQMSIKGKTLKWWQSKKENPCCWVCLSVAICCSRRRFDERRGSCCRPRPRDLPRPDNPCCWVCLSVAICCSRRRFDERRGSCCRPRPRDLPRPDMLYFVPFITLGTRQLVSAGLFDVARPVQGREETGSFENLLRDKQGTAYSNWMLIEQLSPNPRTVFEAHRTTVVDSQQLVIASKLSSTKHWSIRALKAEASNTPSVWRSKAVRLTQQ